jgi:hypothetical protein
MDTGHRPVERRIYRNHLPRCEQCASRNVQVATRVDRFIYMRCPDCLHTWSVPKTAPAWQHYTTR